ncbi:hypothetical protein O181_062703 [Austropuccinia psidii MF-1]|uniref:Uncharacterized protein n=1 Tax=Austropuccinia psidii MF-1 TaxID=1389203 RepID=A0A9Q3EQ79_9BASI|nr:hypothetical protein [Austropuccinia psidii MF-1]
MSPSTVQARHEPVHRARKLLRLSHGPPRPGLTLPQIGANTPLPLHSDLLPSLSSLLTNFLSWSLVSSSSSFLLSILSQLIRQIILSSSSHSSPLTLKIHPEINC